MNNIIEPNNLFDFSKISLANPTGVQGGAYFTKILYNLKPLYIQTQQSLTRQGFIKTTGKKFYIDLMFDNNSSDMINWFVNLEERCQKLLFEKSETWFQNTLELNDIETAFNSTIRVYRSGKYYLVRCNAKSNSNNEPLVKIYDEDENSVLYTDINNEIKIISILEIQGIKFTSRNFQIEIEIKQIMTINEEPIFESCLIKTNNLKKDNNENMKVEEDLIMKQNDNIDLGINLINKDKSEENREEECLDIIENFNDEIKDNSEISKLEMQNNENDKNQK